MDQSPPIFASRSAKLALRAGLSVVALLILRGIIGSIPMLKNSSAVNDSFLADTLLSPIVITNAIIDTVVLVVVLTSGLRLGRIIHDHGKQFAEVGKIVSQATVAAILILAYKMYELPAACFFVGRTDLVNLNVNAPSGAYGDFIRVWGQLINQVNAAAIQNASGDTLNAYQQLALAVFRRPPNYYAWTFLILIVIPVIGLVPLVYRNLDALADLLSHGAAAALQGIPGSSPATPATPVPSVTVESRPNVVESLTLRQIVDKIAKLKTLLDSGAISGIDFDTQKRRILALPVDSASATEPEDFLKLKALLDSGALTESEFETQKQRVLQQI